MSSRVPRVGIDATFKQVVNEVTDKHMGTTFVYDADKPVGIITDGDIRRAIRRFDDLNAIRAAYIMSPNYKRVPQDALLTDALELLDKYNITTLAVTSQKDADIIGILSIHHIIDFVN